MMKGTSISLVVTVLAVGSAGCQLSTGDDTGVYSGPVSDTHEQVSISDGHCPLHGVEMSSDTVSIVYGRLVSLPEYAVAEESTFPHAANFIEGGCVVSPDSPATGQVQFCSRCRDARDSWIASHD